MLDQILLHDVGGNIDEYLFGGGEKEQTGVFGTMIWEKLQELDNIALVSKSLCNKYDSCHHVDRFFPKKNVVDELKEDLKKRVTKTNAIEKYRLTQTQLNGEVPYITKRHPWFAHQPPIRLYKNVDLIRACYRRHGNYKNYRKYNMEIIRKRCVKFNEQLYRMKYIWCIIKVIESVDDGHYDYDFFTNVINLREDIWKGIYHYIEYGTILSKRSYTQQELRQINVIDWLFDDLTDIFYQHTDLLKLCKEDIEFPTTFEDDMEVAHLRNFIKNKELYVCTPTLTDTYSTYTLPNSDLQGIHLQYIHGFNSFFYRLTRAILRLSIVDIIFHSYPSLTNSS